LRPVLRLDLLHLAGDALQRLVPTDAPPFALAARTGAHERIVEPARMVELFDRGDARLRAELAAVDRVVRVARNLLDDPVDQAHERAATAVTVAAHCLDDGFSGRCGLRVDGRTYLP